MKPPRHDLAIRFNEKAKNVLLDFVNSDADPPAFARFKTLWEKTDLKWRGGLANFRSEQQSLREVWEGKKRGVEHVQAGLALGLLSQAGDESIGPPPVAVDWENSALFIAPRNLSDLIWLTLLQHSMKLAVCEGRAEGCVTPYFIRNKPNQRVCSDACAKLLQREAKRRWWSQNGPDWRKARKHGPASGEDGA